jgi:membrane fusion protein, heavy metal efflux system
MNTRKQLQILVFTLLLCVTTLILTACNQADKDAAQSKTPDNVVPVSQESAQHLDLRTETVALRTLATELHVTGRIQAEVTKEIDVSPRFTGRVVEVCVKPGSVVKPGEPLAKVDSQEVSQMQAELIEAQSKLEIAKAQEERERQIYEETLQRPKDLLAAQAKYDALKVKQELAEMNFKRVEDLYDEKIAPAKDFQSAKAELAQSEVAFKEADTLLQREKRLYKNKALLRKDLQLAHAEMLREKQHVDTLKQRLILFGMPKAMVERVVSTSTITPFVPIVSPVAGSITAHQVAVGEIVSPDKKFMTVTDLSTVMMTADIPEVDVPQVRMGAPVEIKVSAFPQETFNGIISYVSDVVNPTTRTVAIRASLPNPHRKLKTNMWAEIDLPGAPASVLAVPKAAVQERAGSQVVYVATSGGYEEHRIEVGRDFGEYLEIKTGLREGDQVATQGSLLLRTAMTNRQTTEQ